jgi:hypothetical protein
MLLHTLSVANMLLHANRWREVQRDTANLLCDLENRHLRTGKTSVGQTGSKRCFIFQILFKDEFWKKQDRVSE